MPGFCTFERKGGVWFQVTPCNDSRKDDCPPIANFKLADDGLEPEKKDKDADFLATFKSAFGNDFTFTNTDVLELACDEPGDPVRESVYKRVGKPDRKFKLNVVNGHEFRKVVQSS